MSHTSDTSRDLDELVDRLERVEWRSVPGVSSPPVGLNSSHLFPIPRIILICLLLPSFQRYSPVPFPYLTAVDRYGLGLMFYARRLDN